MAECAVGVGIPSGGRLRGAWSRSSERLRSSRNTKPLISTQASFSRSMAKQKGHSLAENLARRSPYFDLASSAHAYTLACAGKHEEAKAILERLQWLSRERFVPTSFNSAICVALGDLDGAIEALQAAADARCPWFFQMLADPRLKPLHGRAEFDRMKAVLDRMESSAN